MLALGGATWRPDSAADSLSNPGPPMEGDGLSGQPHPSWSTGDTPGGGGPVASDGAPSPNLPEGVEEGLESPFPILPLAFADVAALASGLSVPLLVGS